MAAFLAIKPLLPVLKQAAVGVAGWVGRGQLTSQALAQTVRGQVLPAGVGISAAQFINHKISVTRSGSESTDPSSHFQQASAKLMWSSKLGPGWPMDRVDQQRSNGHWFVPLGNASPDLLEPYPAFGGERMARRPLGGKQAMAAGDADAYKLPGYSQQKPSDDRPQEVGYVPKRVDTRVAGKPALITGPELHLTTGWDPGSENWRALHPQTGRPLYHGPEHSQTVGQMHSRVVRALGGSNAAASTFAEQIGQVHDLDPYRNPGSPPKVSRTVDVLRADFAGNQPLLDNGTRSLTRDAFGWTEQQLEVAITQILRTDHPFLQAQQDAYESALRGLRQAGLSDAQLQRVMQEAAALSEISDKASTYLTQPFGQSLQTTHALAEEIGNGMTAQQLRPHVFLDALERPNYSADYAIAQHLDIEFSPLPLERVATSTELDQLRTNRRAYEAMFGGD